MVPFYGYSPLPAKQGKPLTSGLHSTRQGMSQNPESVPFVRRALQISRPDELWSTLARHAAVAERRSYSIGCTWVCQLFSCFSQFFFPSRVDQIYVIMGMRPP